MRPLLVGAVLCTSVLVGPHAQAAPTGHRAYITWNGHGDQLHLTDGRGGNARLVPGTVDPWAPALSPDGTSVAYSDYATPGDYWMTLVISPTRGQGRRILDLGPDWITEPAWSPDGKQLAFAREREVESTTPGVFVFRCTIDVVDLRSGQVRTIGDAGFWTVVNGGVAAAAAAGACAANPAWSPRGDLVAFVAPDSAGAYAVAAAGTERDALFTVHPDGTGLKLLSPTAAGYGLDFSPDGTRLAYGFSPRQDGGAGQQLHTIAVDGSDDRVVMSLEGGNLVGYPAWAPSGHEILAEVDPPSAPSYLATVDLRNGRVTRATRPAGGLQFESPDWSR